MGSLMQQLFYRTHSGNLAMLRNAEDRWRGLDIRPDIRVRFEHETMRNRVTVQLINPATREVFHGVDFSDYQGIMDGDVFCNAVGSWLNHRFNEYRTWQ